MSKKTELNEYVLIVDDERDLLEDLADLVKDSGLKVVTVASASDGLKEITKDAPFLIISDFRMSGMNGLEFCREVKKQYLKIPFILLTAYADKNIAMEGITTGLSEILEKPFDNNIIKNTLKKYADARIYEIEEEKKELDELIDSFVAEITGLLENVDDLILRLEETPIDATVIDSLFRAIHSVKGGAGVFPAAGLLKQLAHVFESDLSLIRGGKLKPESDAINVFLSAADLCKELIGCMKSKTDPSEEISKRVNDCISVLEQLPLQKEPKADAQSSKIITTDTEKKLDETEDEGVFVTNKKLDEFMKLSGEMIVMKNYFDMFTGDRENITDSERMIKKLGDFSYSLNKMTDQLQEQIMSVRKVRLEKTFNKLPRMVRQVSKTLGKQIKLKKTGMELGVDKNIANAHL